MPQVERSKTYFTSGIVTGSGGTTLNSFISGTACLNCPSATGHATVVSASLVVSGISNGDAIFVQAHTAAPSAMFLKSACAIAGGISASWANSACLAQAASGDVVISYLAIK